MIKSNIKNMTPSRQAYRQEITLLSGGYVNPTAFPDGKITVYPWDHEVDEWIQQRGKKPRRHLMLWELAERLCNLNGCKREQFLVGDVNTVILVARAIVHKNIIRYTPVCSHCGTANAEDSVKVPDELEKVAEKPPGYPGFDLVILPESQDHVKVRPLTIGDEISIEERTKEQKAIISDDLAQTFAAIVSIGDGAQEGQPDSMQELSLWWQALHPADKKALIAGIEKCTPHLSGQITHKCDHCEKPFLHNLTFDTNFFR